MNRTNEVLDALMKELKISSDYAASKALGVTRATVSGWRTGKSGMADEVAIKAAKILSVDAGELIAQLHAERAGSVEAAAIWKRIAVRLRHAAAVMVIGIAGITGLFSPSPVQAASVNSQECILCNILKIA